MGTATVGRHYKSKTEQMLTPVSEKSGAGILDVRLRHCHYSYDQGNNSERGGC